MTIEKPQSAEIEALALARRSGWPQDLRVLMSRYPREKWDAHTNLGEMARFWLSRHAMFRELSGVIEGIAGDFRAGRVRPAEFQALSLLNQRGHNVLILLARCCCHHFLDG